MKQYYLFIAIIGCLFLAGMSNGLMDALHFHEAWKCFDNAAFWNPETSWKNKWAMSAEGVPIVGKERFWGSSTFLVALTDGWHLSKFGWLFFIKSAVVLALFADMQKWRHFWGVVVVFAAATLAHAAGFMIIYSIIF